MRDRHATARALKARRDRRRFAVNVRQAALHATAEVLVELEQLTRLVRLEQIAIDQAEELVAQLRRRQHSTGGRQAEAA